MFPTAPATTVATQLPRIRRDVGVDDRALALTPLSRVAVFHADHAQISLRMNVLEDLPVVDLSRSRLAPSGVVAHLDVRDLVPRRVHVGDQVTLSDLLVVDVEEDLA